MGGGGDKEKGSRKIGVMCAGSKGTRLRASEMKTSSETETFQGKSYRKPAGRR